MSLGIRTFFRASGGATLQSPFPRQNVACHLSNASGSSLTLEARKSGPDHQGGGAPLPRHPARVLGARTQVRWTCGAPTCRPFRRGARTVGAGSQGASCQCRRTSGSGRPVEDPLAPPWSTESRRVRSRGFFAPGDVPAPSTAARTPSHPSSTASRTTPYRSAAPPGRRP